MSPRPDHGGGARRLAGILRGPVRIGWHIADACTVPWRRPRGRAVVLCFGDSNTWGYVPGTGWRYRRADRWPGVVAHRLDGRVFVVEQGRNGRTTDIDDGAASRNGARALSRWLARNPPPDFAVVCLGTNDLKHAFGRDADAVAGSLAALVELLRGGAGRGVDVHRILLVCPAPLVDSPMLPAEFAGRVDESRRLAARIARVAERAGCAWLDAGDRIRPSRLDGLHLEREAHRQLGEMVASWLGERL